MLFAPSVEEIIPRRATRHRRGAKPSAGRPFPSRPLSRRSHRRSQLFNIVTPDTAFFGQKDAAQVSVIRRWCATCSPVEIVVAPSSASQTASP